MYVNYIFYFLQAFVFDVDIVIVGDGIDADYRDVTNDERTSNGRDYINTLLLLEDKKRKK